MNRWLDFVLALSCKSFSAFVNGEIILVNSAAADLK